GRNGWGSRRDRSSGAQRPGLHAARRHDRSCTAVSREGRGPRSRGAAGVGERRDTGRTMSQENVEVVGDYLRAFADGGIDAMVEFMDRDVDWRAIEGAPDDVGEMHGREAMGRYIQDWVDMFADTTNVPEDLLALGDNRLI